ncbi:hypothetical protein EAS61_35045 [Bradyrhizobium zhanjiangense]|uniref:Nucleotidyltransferase-like domain-containing protein n=1 Tax=Bradyrhizobium zhanjiangense TaxID=1325107 RepID=A0A4Q0Q918_9BRAD|nr:hypothetical protein EAS61_35045 [Bradyrhizobium zhanjiangense]
MVTNTYEAFFQIDKVMFSDLVQKRPTRISTRTSGKTGAFSNRSEPTANTTEPSGGEGPTKKTLKYVGAADDPEIAKRAEAFQRTKIGYRARRELAAKLRRAGYPAPPHMEGLVVNELARAGLFRLRATLVGSMAYQTYSGVLGVKLPDELVTTEDMDKFYGISISIDESMPNIEEILKRWIRHLRPHSPPMKPSCSAVLPMPPASRSNSSHQTVATRTTPPD